MSEKSTVPSVDDSADPSTPLLTDGGAEAEQAEGEEQPEGQEGEAPEAEGEEEEGEQAEGEEGEGASAKILHFDLEGLFLNLLGLHVDLDEVILDIDGVQGPNNLLGNLLSAVWGCSLHPVRSSVAV